MIDSSETSWLMSRQSPPRQTTCKFQTRKLECGGKIACTCTSDKSGDWSCFLKLHCLLSYCLPSITSQHLKLRPKNCNISTQHIATLLGEHIVRVWPPCCDMFRHFGCCWLKFENGQIFYATFVDVAWCAHLARFVQQCCAQACCTMLQQGGQTRATCCAQQCCDLLRLNVMIIWPELANAGPTLLGYVVLRCCYLLAGALGRYM